ncbi:unnamed protein product, partial [Vitis vinifera]|uniref:Uncharacterized protein n=1 Tax=Vitis vinifera TaxID=29760 RepID=D7TXM3_VITVI
MHPMKVCEGQIQRDFSSKRLLIPFQKSFGQTFHIFFSTLSWTRYFSLQWIFLVQILKVSEMKDEYFPPKEDLILQNEAPMDFYLIVWYL